MPAPLRIGGPSGSHSETPRASRHYSTPIQTSPRYGSWEPLRGINVREAFIAQYSGQEVPRQAPMDPHLSSLYDMREAGILSQKEFEACLDVRDSLLRTGEPPEWTEPLRDNPHWLHRYDRGISVQKITNEFKKALLQLNVSSIRAVERTMGNDTKFALNTLQQSVRMSSSSATTSVQAIPIVSSLVPSTVSHLSSQETRPVDTTKTSDGPFPIIEASKEPVDAEGASEKHKKSGKSFKKHINACVSLGKVSGVGQSATGAEHKSNHPDTSRLRTSNKRRRSERVNENSNIEFKNVVKDTPPPKRRRITPKDDKGGIKSATATKSGRAALPRKCKSKYKTTRMEA